MAKYELGIMENPPEKGRRYDKYNPWDYPRLEVIEDDVLDPVLLKFKAVVYWHTLDIKADVVAMTGINLIPPESLPTLICLVKSNPELIRLEKLLETAVKENKFVILFGL